MSDEEYRKIIVTAYEYFYRIVTADFKYTYTPIPSDESALDNFLASMRKEYGKNLHISLILTFIEHSFDYWVGFKSESTRKTRYGLKGIMLSWIIGKPAIKRFENMSERVRHFPRALRYIHRTTGLNIYSEFGIEQVIKPELHDYIEVNPNEEYWKKMNHNTKHGLPTCVENTKLFNHKSELCMTCTAAEKCKGMLKESYKMLYKLRGYGE